MQINLKNNHIMVKEIVRKEAELETSFGFVLPEETLEEEQVSQGKVVRSNSNELPVGCTVLFHKVLPIDVNMKLDEDTDMEVYFFIPEKDIICSIIE